MARDPEKDRAIESARHCVQGCISKIKTASRPSDLWAADYDAAQETASAMQAWLDADNPLVAFALMQILAISADEEKIVLALEGIPV
jgi:hypothetical protein